MTLIQKIVEKATKKYEGGIWDKKSKSEENKDFYEFLKNKMEEYFGKD